MEREREGEPNAEYEVEPVGFVDWYDVADWPRLESVFAGRRDVEGSREEGWDVFAVAAGSRRRVASVFAEERGALAVEAKTEADADWCGRWLERVAPGAAEFAIGSEIGRLVDPA